MPIPHPYQIHHHFYSTKILRFGGRKRAAMKVDHVQPQVVGGLDKRLHVHVSKAEVVAADLDHTILSL